MRALNGKGPCANCGRRRWRRRRLWGTGALVCPARDTRECMAIAAEAQEATGHVKTFALKVTEAEAAAIVSAREGTAPYDPEALYRVARKLERAWPALKNGLDDDGLPRRVTTPEVVMRAGTRGTGAATPPRPYTPQRRNPRRKP